MGNLALPSVIKNELLPVTPHVRARLLAWIEQDWNKARALSRAVGISFRTLAGYVSKLNALPSLREALAIECITEGAIKCYDWCDTEAVKKATLEDGELRRTEHEHSDQPGALKGAGEYFYDKDGGALLRKQLLKYLAIPNNAMAVVVHLGQHPEKARHIRRQQTQIDRYLPITVDGDATDDDIEEARRARARREYLKRAYRRGLRRDF